MYNPVETLLIKTEMKSGMNAFMKTLLKSFLKSGLKSENPTKLGSAPHLKTDEVVRGHKVVFRPAVQKN